MSHIYHLLISKLFIDITHFFAGKLLAAVENFLCKHLLDQQKW